MMLAEWDDPDVQTVYDILCDTSMAPPDGEHYEGFMARRIVAALRAKHTQHKEPRNEGAFER